MTIILHSTAEETPLGPGFRSPNASRAYREVPSTPSGRFNFVISGSYVVENQITFGSSVDTEAMLETAEILGDPETMELLRQGREDLAAGRMIRDEDVRHR